VELYRYTAGPYGDNVFLGFVDGTVKGAPAASGRLIEVIGDSISAGYGNLGMWNHSSGTGSCSFTLDTEAAYQAYPWVLARTLDAEVSIIAHSGWGMVRDYNGTDAGVMPSIYANTLGTETSPTWGFARKPDAVLIDLGTNDSAAGDPGTPFETAYTAFLKTVRGHYPGAWIFLTIGPMTSDPLLTTMRAHLAAVVTAAADAKVTTIDMATQDSTVTGCDYHPTVGEDQTMAAALATAIRAKLGW
jgi:lysophospholipase L1-like esterase